jgi:alpha-tubulin suppressor-like RCC1 family protein
MSRFVIEFEDYREDPIITSMAAGEKHSIVSTKGGKIFSFGYNQQG